MVRYIWWQRHIVEVLRGVPPEAGEGTVPRAEYDPAVFSLTRRGKAKAAKLTAAGHPVTASAIAKRRRRYQEQGLLGMVDHRAGKRMPPHGRADGAVVAAMSQAISEATDESTRTAVFVFRRTRQILDGPVGKPAAMPSRRTLYRLFGRLQAGRHTTGSAKTRRSLAARPEGPFGQVAVTAPGDLMQIDSTPLDVLVRLDDGITGRVDLAGIIDVATRTVTAAVLRPTTKSVDASVLLARTVTPEPMRPGWPETMQMSASELPFRRMLSINERLARAAARRLIIPQMIVVDHGKVFVSESFKASCAFLGIGFQPARKATGTDKPHIERTLGSVATMFAQYVSGYTGRSTEYRGHGTEEKAVWSLPELQDLLGQWIIAGWQNRPHDGLRDPLYPGRAFTPNEKYAALTETAGYVPLALSPDDYVELLPATWRAVNAYGIKISRRVYDSAELNPLWMQHCGVTARKGLWEVHYDPYDISRIWIRDHWNGGWITVFWTQLHRVAAPFGELAWDHARKLMPSATEAELAGAVDDLLTRAGQGPGSSSGPETAFSKRDRRVAGRTRAARLALISGTTTPAIRNALPAFGSLSGRPARAATACRRCTAARRIQQPVPVRLPAHHQACLRHGVWLSRPGAPQFSVSECPGIIAAERQARRLLRRCTIEQLIYARIQAARQPGSAAQISWKQRMHALITSNPRAAIESCPQELFTAAGYPETVTTTARMIQSRDGT